jgi:hypothetical protein
MGYLTVAKAFFSSLGLKGYLYIFIGILCISLLGYGTYKYTSAISDYASSQDKIVELNEKINEKTIIIKEKDQEIKMLDASVRSKDGTITLLRDQIELSNKLRESSEKERREAEKKFTDVLAKHKNEKDATISPKLANILNDLEKDQK